MANFTSGFFGMIGRFLEWLKTFLQQVQPVPTPAPTPVPPTPQPVPVPTPTPTPVPVPVTNVFTENGNLLTLDMNTLPGSMRNAGFSGSDNALYYTMAHVYAFGPNSVMPDDSAGSLAHLNTLRSQISSWFDKEVLKAGAIVRANVNMNMVAITNDGRDRCGFRLGPAIVERLRDLGSRIQLGHVIPAEEYL